MVLRPRLWSAIAASALAFLSACHGHAPSSGSAAASAPSYSAVGESVPCPYAPAGATPLVAVAGLGTDFAIQPGATLVELPTGRAFLAAVLARRSAPEYRLVVRLYCAGGLRPGQPGYIEQALPRAEMAPEAYRAAGGPVDLATWRFYGVERGEMRGIGALAGVRLDLAAADATGLQCGPGADNLDVAPGASVRLSVAGGDTLLAGAQPITIAFATRTSERTYAVTSPGDPVLGGAPRPVLSIPALGGAFDVIAGGSFVERADGSLRFDAVLADADATDRRYALTLTARDRRDAQAGFAGSPHREFPPTAYREGGGPLDEGTWRYYRTLEGSLHGLEALAGAEASVRAGTFALQTGYGASGVDGEFGASASLTLVVVSQPLAGPQLPWGAADGVLRATLRRAHVATADEPVPDPGYGGADGHALRVPGLAEDFVVVTGGEFCERTDGAAELFAEIASAANPDERWTLALQFGARVDAGDPAGLPVGSPALDLAAGAYADQGGPIEPGEWHYYAQAVGELRGIGARAGARISLAGATPAVQVGEGANGANLEFGLSAGLAATLASQPTNGALLPTAFGPCGLRLVLERIGDRCVAAAARDATASPLVGDAALRLPGIAEDLVLLPGARLAERSNGTAELRGVVARASNPAQRFLADLRFAGRIDRGVPPPAGSPELEMHASAYVGGGGQVDPGTWHYYLATEGSLTGVGAWHGAGLRLSRSGPAFQVGTGASGRNTRYGASGSVLVEVLTQPSSGPSLGSSGLGEWNVNLYDACP